MSSKKTQIKNAKKNVTKKETKEIESTKLDSTVAVAEKIAEKITTKPEEKQEKPIASIGYGQIGEKALIVPDFGNDKLSRNAFCMCCACSTYFNGHKESDFVSTQSLYSYCLKLGMPDFSKLYKSLPDSPFIQGMYALSKSETPELTKFDKENNLVDTWARGQRGMFFKTSRNSLSNENTGYFRNKKVNYAPYIKTEAELRALFGEMKKNCNKCN